MEIRDSKTAYKEIRNCLCGYLECWLEGGDYGNPEGFLEMIELVGVLEKLESKID